jgi:hypothetical protein
VKTALGFDWRDVFSSAGFLFTLTGVFLLWIATVASYWNAPSVRTFSRVSLPLLCLGVCFTTPIAIKQSTYTYNEMGFYQSQHWKLRGIEGDDKTFSTEVIAVQDLSQHPFFVDVSIASACPKASIVDFTPTLADEQGYRFRAEDDVTVDPSKNRKWKITEFQPPGKMVLLAKIRNDRSCDGSCLVYIVTWSSKK